MHHQTKVLFSFMVTVFSMSMSFADMQWGGDSDSGRHFREERGGWRRPQVEVSMWGNGCPAQTPEGIFSREGDEFALMVRGYGVELRGGFPGSSFSRDCQWTINIRHRPFMQFRVESLRYRGFAIAQSAQVFQSMSIQVDGRTYQGDRIFSVLPFFSGPLNLDSNISYGWGGGDHRDQDPLPPPPPRRDPRDDDRVMPPPPYPGPRAMSFDGGAWERDHWGNEHRREEERRRREEERRRNEGWSRCGDRESSVVLNSRIGVQNLQGPGLNRIAIESPRPEEAPGFRLVWRECSSGGW